MNLGVGIIISNDFTMLISFNNIKFMRCVPGLQKTSS